MAGTLALVAVAGRSLATLTGGAVLAGAMAYSAGTVHIRVYEKRPEGTHLRLLIPSLAVTLGAELLPARVFQHIPQEAREILPALRIVSRELERCPDGPLVDVRTPRETVLVAKKGGDLVVDVDTPQETVHVAFPLAMATSVIREIEATGPGN